jgi:hypothetical protein
MAKKIKSNSENSYRKLIGEILLEADLISQPQLEMALADQNNFFLLKLGEILALRGWVKRETVDFLVEKVLNEREDNCCDSEQKIGEFLQQAGLLTHEQISVILQEQKKLGTKFGYLAMLKGFLTEKTLTFFLEKVLEKNKIEIPSETIIEPEEEPEEEPETLIYSPEDLATDQSARVDELDSYATQLLADSEEPETLIFPDGIEDAMLEEEEEIIITPRETITINSQETKVVYYNNIAYGPMYINS